MNRFLLCTVLLWTSASVSAGAPNVLFIAVDDLRPELGCYGAAHVRSPNIDALAQRGMLFERAYCQVAVCNPSRNSLLSGCRPETTGIYDNDHYLRPEMPDIVTLPQHFKNHGYTSLSLGKVYHHSDLQPGDDPQSWSEPAWYCGPDGAEYTYRGEANYHWFTKESLDYVKRLEALPKNKRPGLMRAVPFEAAEEPDDAYLDGQTATKAVETLQRLKAAQQPFFLAVGFMKPHLPFTCPQKYWDLYPAETIKLPDNNHPPQNVPAHALHDWYELRGYGTVPAEGDIPDGMARNLIRGYLACVSFIDAQVGRVIAELDRLGLRDNTIIILWGDHGYHLGENGIYTKMTNFELGTRVPLILTVPGQKTAGHRTHALVELVDVYPTLAELCGLPLPDHLEGISLEPLLSEPDRAWKAAAFSLYRRRGKDKIMGHSIRTDHWRYTEWVNKERELVGVELYDHRIDPAENDNLAAHPAQEETAAELARRLHDGWQKALPPARRDN